MYSVAGFKICCGITFIFHKLQVGVIGNLVHSSPNIKKEVLAAGALQPVIGLLRFVHSRVALLLSVHWIWRAYLFFSISGSSLEVSWLCT